jgi:hypothetical protein
MPAAAASTTSGEVQWLHANVMSVAGETTVLEAELSTTFIKSR